MPIDFYIALIFVVVVMGGLAIFIPWWNDRQERREQDEQLRAELLEGAYLPKSPQ